MSTEQTEGTRETDLEGTAKAILAWGSVSYACGFVTVLLHTWRLGLPVVELIEPIYVWIGLPIAIVAFFWKQLLTYFGRASSRLAADFHSSISDILGKFPPEELSFATEMLRLIDTFPGSWLFLRGPVRRFIETRLGLLSVRLQNEDPVEYQRQLRGFRRVIGFTFLINGIQTALFLFVRVVAIPAALALYVWAIYPLIPQSLGGGRATPVRIVVKADSLPPGLPVQIAGTQPSTDANRPAQTVSRHKGGVQVNTSPAAESKDNAVSAVLAAELLYMTKEFFFVELRSGVRLSIKADEVRAVVWSPRDKP